MFSLYRPDFQKPGKSRETYGIEFFSRMVKMSRKDVPSCIHPCKKTRTPEFSEFLDL